MNYTYQLEKGSRKFRCPKCEKKTFVRFISTSENKYAKEEFGRCDRESKCGYFKVPHQDKSELKKIPFQVHSNLEFQKQTYIPNTVLEATQKRYDLNTFVNNLLENITYPMPREMVMQIVNRYKVGTISKGFMAGALTIPFVSKTGKVNAIQVKLFDERNHTIKTNFLHSIIANHHKFKNKPTPLWLSDYLKNDKVINCLFGEHLLNSYPHNPVALVEAPKTALYASLYFGMPQCKSDYLWLAVFNKSSLTYDKLKVLNGRTVVLFPDLNAYDDWYNKAKMLEPYLKDCHISVSGYLEHNAEEEDKEKGLDLGDYLIKYDWQLFNQNIKPKKEVVLKEKMQLGMKAFVDNEGVLYLKQSFMDDYTVYPSIRSFKYRECLPCFVSSDTFELGKCREIDLSEVLKLYNQYKTGLRWVLVFFF